MRTRTASEGSPRIVERRNDRAADALRPITIQPGYLRHAEGSALIDVGDTRVLCAASVEGRTPRFLRNTGSGWVTAEYGMLPRATHTRSDRASNGRAQEIQRLIGRALRSAVDLDRLGEQTVVLDCDVLQADGGTRTAAITGAWVALAMAMDWMQRKQLVPSSPLRTQVAATSVGVIEGTTLLDLDYEEDSAAGVDCNVVMLGTGRLVEVQSSAEGEPFNRQQMNAMIDLATSGIQRLFEEQKAALAAGREAAAR